MSFHSEEDLSCPVCRDIFKDPVVLTCSHSFCRTCLQTWFGWNLAQECPVCKRRSSRSGPPQNLALKNLCESFLLTRYRSAPAGGEAMCGLHDESLKLFCLDHQRPVCLICRDSKSHSEHRFRPVHEYAEELKKELQEALRPLQEKLKLMEQTQENYDQTARHIQTQARFTEEQIKERFEKLQQFLREEEAARVAAVREEERQKSQVMKEKMDALSGDIADLSRTVTDAEDELGANDASFLLSYKETMERVRRCPLQDNPQPVSGALMDVAKHLGNLTYNIWSKMKDLVSYSPVVLDPNTANPEYVLSEDLTSLRHGDKQALPENPERLDYHRSVRGREGFSSGVHTWGVEVRDNSAWFVGVAAKFVHKRERVKSWFWQVEFYNGRYSARMLGDPPVGLRVKKKVQKVRVYLDWNRGKVCFFDSDSDMHIYTFTHTFTHTLFPCMGTLSNTPLQILPERVSVTREYIT